MATNGIIYYMIKKLNSIFYMRQALCSSACNPANSWKWDITQITSKEPKNLKYAVLILNRPIVQSQNFIKDLWNNAAVRITIDGGTNRWDSFVSKFPQEKQIMLKIPTLITGDFDSIKEDVLKKYKKKGCKVVHTPDQMDTDFTKALMELNTYCKENGTELGYVIAIGENSGRLDQILGNIQTLFLNKDRRLLPSTTGLYYMADDSLSWLLYPGEHVITVPEDTRTFKRSWCSLVPIGETCERVTSTGLKWNLDDQPLKFGDLISTSNAFSGSENVTVKCSHTLLWSMKIPSLFNPV